MTTVADVRFIRANVRRGNQKLRLRRELRALDDKTLMKRLGKYLGRTPSEVMSRYHTYGGWHHLDRDAVIEAIITYEVPNA